MQHSINPNFDAKPDKIYSHFISLAGKSPEGFGTSLIASLFIYYYFMVRGLLYYVLYTLTYTYRERIFCSNRVYKNILKFMKNSSRKIHFSVPLYPTVSYSSSKIICIYRIYKIIMPVQNGVFYPLRLFVRTFHYNFPFYFYIFVIYICKLMPFNANQSEL